LRFDDANICITKNTNLPKGNAMPNAQQSAAATLIRSYLAAMEARDLPAARALLGPGFAMTFPGGRTMTALDELIAWAATRYRFVTKAYDGFDACDGVVYCRGALAGEWPDGTPFSGIRFIDRFEVTDGLITDQQVWNDLAEIKAMA
jgi:hypothetical protein